MAEVKTKKVRVTHRGIYRGKDELEVGKDYEFTEGEQAAHAGKFVDASNVSASEDNSAEVAELKGAVDTITAERDALKDEAVVKDEALAERDKRIAELEAEVAELKKPAPAPKKPGAK